MKIVQLYILVIFLFPFHNLIAQDETEETIDTTTSIEIYLIDNYVKHDTEPVFVLSWITNLPVKSKINIDNLGIFNVSDTLKDFHQFSIKLDQLKLSNKENQFTIISEFEEGGIVESQGYSFYVSNDELTQDSTYLFKYSSSSYYIYNFVAGFALWLFPSPALVFENNDTKFAIIKDLPIISFGSSSAYKTFPYVYLYTGYSHIFNGNVRNALRYGFRYLYEIMNLRHFISLGLGGFSNFKGKNGITSEVSFSFLRILNTFEVFTSYSYNYLPATNQKFHLLMLGLFTSSFSINLNY